MYNFFPLTILFLIAVLAVIFVFFNKISVVFFFCGIISAVFLFIFFYRVRYQKVYKYRGELERFEEEKNLLSQDIEAKNKISKTMPEKSGRVSFLFNISHKLIGLFDSEEIFDFFINVCLNLFPHAQSVLIFLVQKNNSELVLVRSFKSKDSVIREKKGDILDKWVLKNNQSLAVDDITKDFRFDYCKVAALNQRGMRSFILSPLSIEEKIFGIVRIESKTPQAFSLDDSRLLRSICDLGVVVLERDNLFKSIEEAAIKDPLTALYLRDYFLERFEEEMKRSAFKNTRIGIIMLDIDNFKIINDNYGHIVGDLVLKRLAMILEDIVEDSGNVISRFGGEEFILFIVECDKEQLVSIGENIRVSVEKSTVSFRKRKINFTVSLGTAVYPDDGKEVLDLIDKADQLLYKAKNQGKNRLCF